MVNSLTLAIMAGGKSRRMGTNKALLKIGKQTIIERIITQTKPIEWHQTLIVTNTPEDYQFLGLPMVSDKIADSGALGGIYTALYHSQTPYTMVIACDMPFVSSRMINMMIAHIPNHDAVVPVVDGIANGLHAIYSKHCLDIIKSQIKGGELRVSDFLAQVKIKYLNEDSFTSVDSKLALMNINTPEDLAHARQIIKTKK